MLLHFGESEVPRVNATLLLSLCTGLNAVGIVTFLSVITENDIIIDSKVNTIVMIIVILCLNFYFIFYKKKYRNIEAELSLTWRQEKYKSIIGTIIYVISTGLFLWFSLYYAKEHSSSI